MFKILFLECAHIDKNNDKPNDYFQNLFGFTKLHSSCYNGPFCAFHAVPNGEGKTKYALEKYLISVSRGLDLKGALVFISKRLDGHSDVLTYG